MSVLISFGEKWDDFFCDYTTYVHSKQTAEAIASCRDALTHLKKYPPSSPLTLMVEFALATALFGSGQIDDARQHFEFLLAKDVPLRTVRVQSSAILSNIYIGNGKTNSTSVEVLLRYAELLISLPTPLRGRADRIYEFALDLEPTSQTVLDEYTSFLTDCFSVLPLKQIERRLLFGRRAPPFANSIDRANRFIACARVVLSPRYRLKTRRASEFLTKAIHIDDRNPNLFLEFGRMCFVHRNEVELAQDFFRSCLAYDETNDHARFYVRLAESLNDEKDDLCFDDEEMTANPSDWTSYEIKQYIHSAEHLFRRGLIVAALACIHRAALADETVSSSTLYKSIENRFSTLSPRNPEYHKRDSLTLLELDLEKISPTIDLVFGVNDLERTLSAEKYHGLIDELVGLGFDREKVTVLAAEYNGHREKMVSWLEMEGRVSAIRRRSSNMTNEHVCSVFDGMYNEEEDDNDLVVLKEWLENLRIGQYFETFVENGFENLDTLAMIEKQDLEEMNVKRGHRALLLQELANRT